VPELGDAQFLGEPMQRNTAPCIAWATSLIHRRDPKAVVAVLPSDHHVADRTGFAETVARAVDSALSGVITTIGIKPQRPETGYGYIEGGEAISGGVHRVVRFVEKPNLSLAEAYVASGRYYWNSGMFFFTARAMLDAIADQMPEIAEGLIRIERAAERGPDVEREETERVFREWPGISIDYGVMEKVGALNVVPGDFGWSDVGDWQSVWELGEKDKDGNVAPDHALLIESRSNLVRDLRTEQRPRSVVLVGVEDLCVIETDDALLVIRMDRAQKTRLAVDELALRGENDRL
jgi:mannose-1-phosphate guanylyltransferase